MVDSIQSFSFSFGKLSFVRKIPEIGCGPCAAAAGRNSRTGGGDPVLYNNNNNNNPVYQGTPSEYLK